jgi:hypothetical protein
VLCIFCRNEREPSIEHVFPAAIGGALTIERVCKPCNDRLGAEVDAPLSNHRTILIKRQLLGIARRDGTQIGYEEILGHGKLVKDPDQRVRIVPEPGTGRWKHQVIYKSERIKSEDGTEIVRVTCDPSQAREVKKRIQRNRKREGLRSLSEIELQAEVDDKSKVVIEPSEVLHSFSLDSVRYQRAILKIVYELAWLWLGDAYLDDPIALDIRNTVIDGSEGKLTGQIRLGEIATFGLWKDEPHAHIGLLVAAEAGAEAGISIAVRVFDSMCGRFKVSESPKRYSASAEGRFFCCDPQTGKTRNTTLSQEKVRLAHGI